MNIKYSNTYIERYERFDNSFMKKVYKYDFSGDYNELLKVREIISGFDSKIYQLNYDNFKDYNLFYWDNAGWNQSDKMNYFSITIESDYKMYKDFENLLSCIDSNIEVICYSQYKIIDNKCRKLSNSICEGLLGKKIIYKGMEGKIVYTGNTIHINDTPDYKVYIFQKNRQRTRGYEIKDIDMCLGRFKEVLA